MEVWQVILGTIIVGEDCDGSVMVNHVDVFKDLRYFLIGQACFNSAEEDRALAIADNKQKLPSEELWS